MYHVRDQSITIKQLNERFDDFPSVQSLIDTRTMNLLGKLVRDKVTSPARQLLIAFIPKTRHIGRPSISNKDSLFESLERLLEDIPEIHIDRMASLKDWYLDALDKTFWKQCIARLLHPDLPIPERPNGEAEFNPRRSRRRRASASGSTSPPSPRTQSRGRNRHHQDLERNSSLQIPELETTATLREAVRAHHKLSRIYHPDQHSRFIDTDGRSTRTGLTLLETTEHMQRFNSAREYLERPSTQILE